MPTLLTAQAAVSRFIDDSTQKCIDIDKHVLINFDPMACADHQHDVPKCANMSSAGLHHATSNFDGKKGLHHTAQYNVASGRIWISTAFISTCTTVEISGSDHRLADCSHFQNWHPPLRNMDALVHNTKPAYCILRIPITHSTSGRTCTAI